jgi:hypothetical protein
VDLQHKDDLEYVNLHDVTAMKVIWFILVVLIPTFFVICSLGQDCFISGKIVISNNFFLF